MVDVVVIGAGLRGGYAYGSHGAAAGIRFVGVVEPISSRRRAFAEQHDLDDAACFATVEDWVATERIADGAIVATPDDQHVGPALAALHAGYDVLLEKPMAPTLEQCRELVDTAERLGRSLSICHVLRYTPFFRAVKEVVASGRLGRIVTVEHRENVDARHMAHSYVRGAYRRAADANPMLLAKSCHDLDLLHWILDDPVQRVSSFGSLLHFRPESVGPEVPPRCTDGCPEAESCAFHAPSLYAPEVVPAAPEIAVLMGLVPLADPPSFDQAERLEALRSSPYGRCVYRCDNDVVDHQVVAMELASGATVSFSMHGHSHDETRTMRYDGTEATLRAVFGEQSEITIHDHGSDRVEVVPLPAISVEGHGGGDLGVLQAFASAVAARRLGHAVDSLTTDARTSLESHIVGWAAEEARELGTVVEVERLRTRR